VITPGAGEKVNAANRANRMLAAVTRMNMMILTIPDGFSNIVSPQNKLIAGFFATII
jgi:hypothetical protein